MKLCDRCPVSGCCLDYLGKACENARKEMDPELVPTYAEVLPALEYEELAAVFCFSNSHPLSYEGMLNFLQSPFERRALEHEKS